MVDFDRALREPAAAFARPADVLTAPGLTDAQRVRLLQQWEYDATQMQVAADENMPAPGSEDAGLAEVRAALRELGVGSEAEGSGSKFG